MTSTQRAVETGHTDATEPPHVNTSWIEIDASAIADNLRNLRSYLDRLHGKDSPYGKRPKICSVIKGNAYGHGWGEMVPLLERLGVDKLAVFAGHEAIDANPHLGADSTMEIMGYIADDEVPWVVKRGLQPWIGSPHVLDQFMDAAHKLDRDVNVHMEVETGMNRTGLRFEDAFDACRKIADDDRVSLAGVCSHLAGAEESRNNERIAAQHGTFEAFLEALESQGIDPGVRQLASSSATMLYPEMHYDQVRIGIATYGFWPTPEVRYRLALGNKGVIPFTLRRALSWHSRIMALRDVYDGEYVGYGQGHEMSGDGRIAIVPVGYADGYSRHLGNQGQVLIHGRRCPIIGHVNMNMIQVLVSHLPAVEIGDHVTLIGHNGDEEIGVSSFSDFNNIVNYEVVARLSHDIPRLVTHEAALGERSRPARNAST